MDKQLRWLGAGLVTVLVAPVAGGFVHDAVQQPLIMMLTAWLSVVSHQWWYWYAVVASAAFALGVWLDWIARKFDTSHAKEIVALGHELDEMKLRLNAVIAWNRDGYFDIPGLTQLVADFVALKVSLYKVGLRSPAKNWMPDERGFGTYDGAKPYILQHLGYIGVISPLLKRGHLNEARVAAEKLLPPVRSRWSLVWNRLRHLA